MYKKPSKTYLKNSKSRVNTKRKLVFWYDKDQTVEDEEELELMD